MAAVSNLNDVELLIRLALCTAANITFTFVENCIFCRKLIAFNFFLSTFIIGNNVIDNINSLSKLEYSLGQTPCIRWIAKPGFIQLAPHGIKANYNGDFVRPPKSEALGLTQLLSV